LKKKESVAELVPMFVDSVLKHAEFMFKDSDVANRHYARFMRAIKGLNQLGKSGLSALCDLLSDERLVVRVTAACYVIPHCTERAIKVLKAAAKETDGAISMLAIVTLERWKRGIYLDPATGKEVARDEPKGHP
jgi:hypothetical protein